MESIPAELVKNETQSLVTLVKNEASYLCCFNSYARKFEKKKKGLNAKPKDVNRTIDKARGVSHVTSTALQWKRTTEELVDVENEKCFNDLCLNCWSQYRKGRDLAKLTLDIDKHLDRCNFDIVDGPTDLLGIKHQYISNFMHFDSRKSTFQNLKKALEDDKNMVGLHGLGGTGKTSMATQVGAKLNGSIFGKVILLVVSNPPNFKKLRVEISKKLELELKDKEEEGLQDKILHKISALKEKLLIILDDVWEKFDLTKELGIPPHNQHKGCTVLITTRNEDICKKMDCQSTIPLDTLTIEEAMSLFQEHTGSIPILESSAHNIVKHCHGVPVVIVAVARSLKGRHPMVWKEALRALEHSESILNVNDDLKRVYEGLKLSYDNLGNESAKKLFLISSLFPKDFEIPMEILTRIGVEIGLVGVVDDYNESGKVLDAIMELLDSSLLLNAERECVKMHDLVHELGLLIGENVIQVANESKQLVKEGLRCLLWENDYFPKSIDGTKLEFLLIFLDENSPKNLGVPNTLFTEMTELKVLLVSGEETYYRISATSLLPSIQTLPNLRILILVSFELGSISALGMLPNLKTLWMVDCSVIKGEYFKLQKLRFLRIEKCKIHMSNPLELLESCPKLEELTFLSNEYDEEEEEDKISQKVSFHAFEIYQISSKDLSDYFEEYGSPLSRCFCPGKLIRLMSEDTLKQFASTSELLILEGYKEKNHKNLVPGIIADEQTENLIILKLYSWHGMQCLDDANFRLDVNAFSNLVELTLCDIGLSNMLFNGNYELCHLKFMSLEDCGELKSIFLPSTAHSLSRLEKLKIAGCDALECIIEDKSLGGEIDVDDSHNDQKSYNTLFPKLKILHVSYCGNLEIILPILPGGVLLETITIYGCQNLKYIFDKLQEINVQSFFRERMILFNLPRLVGIFKEHEKSMSASMQRPATTSTKASSFSWTQVSCFKSRATSEEANGVVLTRAWLDERTPQELDASTNRAPLFQSTQSLLNGSFKNIKKMELVNSNFENLVSMSNLSIDASTILWEYLIIKACHQLKCIVSDEGDTGTNMNYSSIFPKLKLLQVSECNALEYLFPVYALEYLESLEINGAPMLNFVFGRSQHEDNLTNGNQNVQTQMDFPALKDLSISRVPKLVSIYPRKYYLRGSSLRSVLLRGFPEFPMRPFNGFLVCWHTKQQETKVFEMSHQSLKWLTIEESKIEEFLYVTDLESEKCGNRLESSLRNLELIDLSELVNICVGPKCILCFNRLQRLTIKGCKNLKVIFSTSVVRSLPMLEYLRILDCEQLVHIIEEHLHPHHERRFPNLRRVIVSGCDKLKYLFSITIHDMFPKLQELYISKAHDLEHVLIRRGDMNQMIKKHDVLPQLEHLFLLELPNLVKVCDGINVEISIDGLLGRRADCPRFPKTSTARLQIADSQVQEKAKKFSSHMSSDQSINTGETTQQSIPKDDLVSKEVKSEVTMTDPSAVGLKNLEKVPIHTSPNLTVLPTSDNTNTNAKFFDEDEEEEEEGTLIISRRHRRRRSGKMTGRSLLEEEKLETSIDETTTTPRGSEWTEKKLSSHLNGKQAAKRQYPTISGFSSSNSTRIDTEVNPSVVDRIDSQRTSSKDELLDQEMREETAMFEPNLQEEMAGGHDKQSHDQKEEQKEGALVASRHPRSGIKPDISLPEKKLETSNYGYLFVPPSRKSSNASTGLAQTPSDDGAKDEACEVWEGTEQMLSSQAVETQQSRTASSNFIRDELVDKVAPNERIMVDSQQSTIGIHNFKENETPNMMEPESQQETAGHEAEEREGGLVTKQHHQSKVKGKRPLLKEELETSNIDVNAISSFEGVNKEGINKTSVVQNQSKTNVACQEGPIVESNDVTKPDTLEDAKLLTMPPFYTAIEMNPSFLEVNNEASNVPGVQEIIDMMKLEGYERSIFAKALETRPQLQLSTKDRSARVLHMSYRVLIDILNILTTRTSFTITEADKRLLGEHLKDACLLGFNKDWIESIKTKVFDSELCEVDSVQNNLKGLENDLKSNEAMLDAIRDEEVEAARVVEVAQQEHADVMARHAQLLKARQDLTARRHKCWEIIAAKNRHFGF